MTLLAVRSSRHCFAVLQERRRHVPGKAARRPILGITEATREAVLDAICILRTEV